MVQIKKGEIMNNQIVIGSIGQIAKQTGRSLAETFMQCDHVVIVDTSGSMGTYDARGNQQRYQVACEELTRLQGGLPGKVAVISFSDNTQFNPDGIPYYHGGSTDMAKALRFALVADVPGISFYLISDGYPDSPGETLAEAAKYKNKINTIYVGPETDASAIRFMADLAAATGGKAAKQKVDVLQDTIKTLMLAAG